MNSNICICLHQNVSTDSRPVYVDSHSGPVRYVGSSQTNSGWLAYTQTSSFNPEETQTQMQKYASSERSLLSSGITTAQGEFQQAKLSEKADTELMAKRKTKAAGVQAQLTKRRSSPRDAKPQNRISPATRDYLDSIEAGGFRLWNASQSQAEHAASQKPSTTSTMESGNATLQSKTEPAQRGCPEGGSPWFQPAAGQWSEPHSRVCKDAAAATSSGTGCPLTQTSLMHS